jgi:hypothetical protein
LGYSEKICIIYLHLYDLKIIYGKLPGWGIQKKFALYIYTYTI